MANDKDRIEYVRDVTRKSPFDAKRKFGIEDDKTKDRRWVDPKKIDERKNGDGYQFVKNKDGNQVKTLGGMVLMERPREIADERKAEKERLTRSRSQSAKDALRNQVESLSSQYGRNLHKYVDEDKS